MKFSNAILGVSFATRVPTPSAATGSGYEGCEVCRADPSECGKVADDLAPLLCAPMPHACVVEGSGCYVPPLSPLAHCLEHDGLRRCWAAHVPERVSSPPRLVVDIHGYSGTALQESMFSGFREKSEEEGFIVVWPQGYQYLQEGVDVFPSFNMGSVSSPEDFPLSQRGCCGAAFETNTDDVGFLRRMIDEVSAAHGVDPKKHVYFTGYSNGCGMAQRMAAEANDIVAAVACASFYLLKSPEDFPKEQYERNGPVPVLEIHGASDNVVPYDGFQLSGVGATSNREAWALYNGCSDATMASECNIPKKGSHVDYSILSSTDGCTGGVEAALVTLNGVDHSIHLREDVPDLASMAWDFMKRYPEEEGGGGGVSWHDECGTDSTSLDVDVNAAAVNIGDAAVANVGDDAVAGYVADDVPAGNAGGIAAARNVADVAAAGSASGGAAAEVASDGGAAGNDGDNAAAGFGLHLAGLVGGLFYLIFLLASSITMLREMMLITPPRDSVCIWRGSPEVFPI